VDLHTGSCPIAVDRLRDRDVSCVSFDVQKTIRSPDDGWLAALTSAALRSCSSRAAPTKLDYMIPQTFTVTSDKCKKKLNSLKHLVRTTVAGSHN